MVGWERKTEWKIKTKTQEKKKEGQENEEKKLDTVFKCGIDMVSQKNSCLVAVAKTHTHTQI